MGTWQDLFLEMHCALITVAGAKAGVIISKPLWDAKGRLDQNMMCVIQARVISIIIIIIIIIIKN